MKCYNCPHYKSGYMHNSCVVAKAECFREIEDCDLVNDDGSLNFENEFIKAEYGEENRWFWMNRKR